MTTATKKNVSAIKSDLIRRGDFFHGGRLDQVAADWADVFSASDAAAWMDVGFWDASAAESMRDAAYTPEKALELSDAQRDAGISYSSGDLIYALCNGDASSDDCGTSTDL